MLSYTLYPWSVSRESPRRRSARARALSLSDFRAVRCYRHGMRIAGLMSAVAALVLLSAAAPAAVAEPALSAPEAHAGASAGALILIDIRTPQEWRETGVPQGARRVDFYDSSGLQGFASKILEQVGGDRHAAIALVCRVGNRTTRAQSYLRSLGFTRVYNVREGMSGSASGPGWIQRGLPLEFCGRC